MGVGRIYGRGHIKVRRYCSHYCPWRKNHGLGMALASSLFLECLDDVLPGWVYLVAPFSFELLV
jgi:hypothetical protein